MTPAADAYRCPAGELLRPMEGRWKNTSGRIEIRYASSAKTCKACPLKARCLSPKASRRTIGRWEHEDVLERHRARMRDASELMRRRSGIVEHPFGTLKCRAGYRHFLVRGLDKVRGEWSLMALCYNFTRVLNILGFEGFVASMAKAFRSLLPARSAPAGCLKLLLDAFWTNMPAWLPIRRFGLSRAMTSTTCPVSTGKSVVAQNLSSPREKYSAFAVGQISSTSSRRPARQEGRIAIVTNARWDAVDATASGAQRESQGSPRGP